MNEVIAHLENSLKQLVERRSWSLVTIARCEDDLAEARGAVADCDRVIAQTEAAIVLLKEQVCVL